MQLRSPVGPRPPLLLLGIGLLALNQLLLVCLCSVAGAVGSVALLFAAQDLEGDRDAVALVVAAALGGGVLLLLLGFAVLSLGVCALAWRGGRGAVKALIAVALVGCVAPLPNPLGILASVLAVLGGLQHLEAGGERAILGGADEPQDPED